MRSIASTRRARGGAAEQMLLREAGAVRASGRRGQAHHGGELDRDVRPRERRRTAVRAAPASDDIPNPTAGPAPIANTGRGPRGRRGAGGSQRWRRSAPSAAVRPRSAASAVAAGTGGSAARSRRGAATFASGAAVAFARSWICTASAKPIARTRRGTVGAHRRERLLAGPLPARVAPLDASVDGAGPAARCGPARARARFRRTGRNPAGR